MLKRPARRHVRVHGWHAGDSTLPAPCCPRKPGRLSHRPRDQLRRESRSLGRLRGRLVWGSLVAASVESSRVG